jgi:hypothetical protein
VPIEFHQHPEYTENLPEFRRYRDLYEGKHSVLISAQYLWPHEIESSTKEWREDESGVKVTVGAHLRSTRARRSRYLNILEPILSTWVSLLFHKDIEVDEATQEMLGDEQDDIDGKGMSLKDFIRGPVALAYFRDGRPNLFVDAPGGEYKSRAEEQRAGFRPYMEVLDVLEVKDWEFFTDGEHRGKYKWLRCEYKLIEPRASAEEPPKESTYCRVKTISDGTYVQKIYRLEEGAWTIEGEIPFADWDQVPVTTIHHNESWLKDISELQLVLFNVMSAWYNQLNTQAFQRGVLAGDLGEKHKISISEYTWAIVPQGTVPHVIEPSTTEPLTQAIDRTVDQMYRVAFNRSRGLAADSKEAPSEETIREMNQELVTLLVSSMTEIEKLVNEALRFYAKFKGIEDFEGKVTLSKDLTADDVAKQGEIYSIYRDEIRKVLDWRKTHLKKVAQQMGYPDDDVDKIEKGIEALKDEPLLNPILLNGRRTLQEDEASNGPTGQAVGGESGGAVAPA